MTLTRSIACGLLVLAACGPSRPEAEAPGPTRVGPPVPRPTGRSGPSSDPRDVIDRVGRVEASARTPPAPPEPLRPIWARALRQVVAGMDGAGVRAVVPASLGVSPHGRAAVGAAFDGPLDLDGVVLRSSRARGAALVHYSEDGAVIWARALSLRGDEAVRHAAVDFTGQVLASGNLGPESVPAAEPGLSPGEDVVLAAFGERGEVRWGARAIGDVHGGAIAAQRSSHVVFTGRFRGDATLHGQPLRSRGGFDLVIGRLSPDGTPLWIHAAGNDGDDEVVALALGPGGEIGLCVRSAPPAGPGRLFLMRYDSDGSLRWGRELEPRDDVLRPAALAFDSHGALLLAGTLRGAADLGSGGIKASGGSDLVLAAYAAAGEPLFARVAGGPGDDEAAALAVSYDDEVLVAGSFADPIVVGPDQLTSAGDRDLFVASFNRHGDPRWARRLGGPGLDGASALVIDGSRYALLTGTVGAGATFGDSVIPGPAGVIVQLLR